MGVKGTDTKHNSRWVDSPILMSFGHLIFSVKLRLGSTQDDANDFKA